MQPAEHCSRRFWRGAVAGKIYLAGNARGLSLLHFR
jgi:hypothetical protein